MLRETGFFGVLHTWGRDLTFHPHAHFLVAGGGIGRDGAWHSSRVSVFVPEQVLESLFKKRLKTKLREADLLKHVPGEVWRGRFVVDSQAIGSGEHALKYLAPYVTRGCVADWRVTACDEVDSIDDARLTLQVKRSGTRQYRGQPLSVIEFIRRWLQHVCPSGFHRVRHYGFLNAQKRAADRRGSFIDRGRARDVALPGSARSNLSCRRRPPMICRKCGGPMVCLGYVPPVSLLLRALEQTTSAHHHDRDSNFHLQRRENQTGPKRGALGVRKVTPKLQRLLDRIHRHHRPASPRPRQPHCSRPSRIAVSQSIEARSSQSAPASQTH